MPARPKAPRGRPSSNDRLLETLLRRAARRQRISSHRTLAKPLSTRRRKAA